MDSTNPPENCSLCGRAIAGGQRMCVCGAVLMPETDEAGLDYGKIIPWVALIGFAITIWWIIAPGMLYYSKLPMFKLYMCISILSASCVMLDAQRLQKQNNGNTLLSPINWFFFLVALWPVALPFYLYVHYQQSDPKRMKSGWVTTGLFLGALLVLWNNVRQPPTIWPGSTDNAQAPAAVPAESNAPRNNSNHAPATIPDRTVDQSTMQNPTSHQSAPRPHSATRQPAESNPRGIAPPTQNAVAPPQTTANNPSKKAPQDGKSYGADIPPVP